MIASVENAILSRLKMASDNDVLGYKYRTLTTSAVEWDAMLKETPGALSGPAAWVIFLGAGREVSDEASPRFTLSFLLVVLAENQRNEEEFRRHGDGRNVGTYQMIWDAAALLGSQKFGLDIGTMKIGNIRTLARSEAIKENKIALLALELSTTVCGPSPILADGDLADFISTDLAWDFAPKRDGAADAHDLVILQEPI